MESQMIATEIDIYQFKRSLIDPIYPVVDILLKFDVFKTKEYLIVSTMGRTGENVVDNFLGFMGSKGYKNLMIML